jgi:prepilin-type N-terminal cleavage/methylation domain-containing protein
MLITKSSALSRRFSLTGFTLIELLVVIGIIGVLATLVTVGVNYARTQARTVKAESDINTIYTAASALGNDTNQWPGHQSMDEVNAVNGNEICADGCTYGLSDSRSGLITTDGSYGSWAGPYINRIPLDPWDNEYFFDTDYRVTVDGEPCAGAGVCVNVAVVGSYGPDGTGNNTYNADDIIKIIAR